MFFQYLKIFFISMIPVIELRGAIPVSQAMGLPLIPSFVVSIIGNMVPVAFIYLFARRILEWGADKKVTGRFFTWVLKKGERCGGKLKKSAGNGLFIALMFFVGVPLPGTGAWTGTLAASLLDMGFNKSVISVLCGVLMAGSIMALVSMLGVTVFLHK